MRIFTSSICSFFAAGIVLLSAVTNLDAANRDDFVDLRQVEPIRGGNPVAGEEKSAVCLACHDERGLSPVPLYPNLRGMTFEYLYAQLRDFKDGQGPQQIMQPIVGPLSDQDLRDVAAYYAQAGKRPLGSSSPASAAPDSDRETLERGQLIYMGGDPEQGLPPCQGCHGADALGHPSLRENPSSAAVAYRLYPPLRGQQRDYLMTKLKEYHDGKLSRSTNDFIMTGIARSLDDPSIQALASWLASLSHEEQ